MEQSNAFLDSKNYLKLETDFEGKKMVTLHKTRVDFRCQVSFQLWFLG